MADEVDIANDRAEIFTADAVGNVRRAAAAIPQGEPGYCTDCGEPSLRLVNLLCAPCRDELAGKGVRHA